MIATAHSSKPYGHLGPRASLRNAHSIDASLQLSLLKLEDNGVYRCELVNGIEDENVVITLTIDGKNDFLPCVEAIFVHPGAEAKEN